MMYNPQLETFLHVVEAGSFSKAAEKLYISAPAVIKQINSLEKSLNLKLFERSYRGLKVTPAGESIYQDAKYIINYCKESITRAKQAMNEKEEVIRVGISPLTPPQVFVELWPRIQQQYDQMKFDTNNHSVFMLHYHLIMCVKYRNKVIDDDISDRLKEIFEYIAPKYNITLEEWNHDVDHVHVLFRGQPNSEISKFINAYKSASSRLIKKEYPKIRRSLWKEMFWSQSYCLMSTGGVTVDIIKQYIQSQGEK